MWHSTEAALANNDTEDINTFKPTMTNEPATPEKEAFLSNGINVRAEESSDPWENTWSTVTEGVMCSLYWCMWLPTTETSKPRAAIEVQDNVLCVTGGPKHL